MYKSLYKNPGVLIKISLTHFASAIALSLLCILFVLAVIDLYFSKVIFNDSYIEIKNSFKKEKFNISDMEKVKIEDHELFIYLKNDKIKRLPDWFSDRHSLYKLLDNRLKTSNNSLN